MKSKIALALDEIFSGDDPTNILRTISISTWEKIEFARKRKGLKIFETTITQEIIYYLILAANESQFNIRLFEANSEKTNGNDIECFIETEKGYLFLPMQAKLIYDNSKYPKISHKIKNEEQIDLLIKYARKKRGYPLYLLYNYCNNHSFIEWMKQQINFQPNLFGISYVDAFYIKNNFFNKRVTRNGEKTWIIPSFENLHPTIAKPFHQLLDQSILNNSGYNFIEENFISENQNIDIQMYTENELIEAPYWLELSEQSSLGNIPFNMVNISKNQTRSKIEFNPMFRIILSSKKKSRRLTLLS